MGSLRDKLFVRLSVWHLRFVYATSRVEFKGRPELMDSGEAFVLGFWHGDSYCYYPLLQNRHITIVTTVNKRGDYVYSIGKAFGYNPVRLPDESNPGVSLLNIRKVLESTSQNHAAFSMDGPLGPYHEPQRLFLTIAYLSKKRVVPVSVEVKGKIRLKRRWDKYLIPLPFGRITFNFNEPLTVSKSGMEQAAEEIKRIMDGDA